MEKFIPLNIPLINCEVELILTWSRSCVLAGMTVRAVPGNNPAIVASSGAKFKKSAFKKTIKWNKYRSQTAIQPQSNNLNYLIGPIFTNLNRFICFVSFTRDNAGDNRDSYSHYYVQNVKIKDCNVLIDGKSFFICQQKMKKKLTKKLSK